MCIRFPSKPAQDLLQQLKAHGGRYRQATGGEPSCWYLPEGNADALAAALGPHPLAALLVPHLPPGEQQPQQAQAPAVAAAAAAAAAPPAPAAAAAAAAVAPAEAKDEDEAPVQPRKKQRRSLRLANPGNCLACMWQLRMLRETSRYFEPAFEHDPGCGF